MAVEDEPVCADLVVAPHPLTQAGLVELRAVELRPGDNVRTLVERGGVDLDQPGWVITIDGAEVHPALWERTRPRHGRLVECRRMAGKDVLRAIAMIALVWFVITVVPFLLGPFLGSAGWSAAAIYAAQAAVYVAGVAIINRVFPPAQMRGPQYRQTQPTYALNGGRNSMRPFEPLPLVMGQLRVLPDFAAQLYTWFEGEDQYQYAVLHAGIGAGDVSSLRIGETPIANFSDVTITRSGFPGETTVLEDWANVDSTPGALLTAPGGAGPYVIRTSSPDTVRLAVDVSAQLYSMADDGGINVSTVAIDVEYRRLPSGAWLPLSDTGFVSVTLTSRDTKPVRATILSVPLAKGQFEVRLRKTTADVSTTRQANAVEWTVLKSYQADEADYTGQPRVGVKIKASGQINGALDTVSWLATGQAIEVWNGSAWVTQVTSNAGAWFLKFARGFYNTEGRLMAGMGLPDSQIDVAGLQSFMTHCSGKGYQWNECLTQQASCWEVLEAIAAAGLGSISYHTGRLGVVWLRDDQPIQGVINMANIKAGSFSVDYAGGDTAEEVEVSFADKANDYKASSVRVLTPGVTVPRSTARLAPMGIKTQAGATTMARIALAQNIYQRKSVSWEMDLEHLTVRRYTLVRLSHDLTQWGYSGRVQDCTPSGVVTLTLDEPIPFTPGASTRAIGLRVPGEQGYRLFSLQPWSGDTRTVTLVEAWPAGVARPGVAADNPAHDTLWIYDFQAQPGQRLRITAIEPAEDMKGARITAVPEPDEFWTFVNTGAFVVPALPPAQQTLAASNVRVTQARLDVSYDRRTELTIDFDVVGPYDHAQVWGGPDGQKLVYLGETRTRRYSGWQVASDGIVDIEVRPFDALGRAGVVAAYSHDVAINSVVATSKLLSLQATSQVFQVTQGGVGSPTSIVFTAQGQNLGGSPAFAVVSGTATLSGSGSSRTLTFGNLTSDFATIEVTWDGLVDRVTVAKVRDGSDSYTGILTNEAANVSANSAGVVSSFANAGGTFRVWQGATELTSGVTFSRVSQTGLTLSINVSTGVYSVSAMSADAGRATLRAVVNGVTIDKIYTLTRSRAGVDARVLTLLATSQVFQISKAGVVSPTSIDLTAVGNALAGSPSFAVTSGTATLTGTGNTRTLTAANMTSDVVTVRATWDTLTDDVTVIKVREGSDAYNAILTNEATTVAADNDGTVASFATAGGEMRVWLGATELTTGIAFSVVSSSGVTISIGATSGIYSVSAMSADSGTAKLRAVVNGVTLDKDYTISKSRKGDSAITSSLSKYAISLPADSEGLVSSYSGANTTMKVKLGGVDDTANWTISRTSTSGITTTLAGDTVTITAMSTSLDSGSITMTATKAGFPSEVLVCQVSKAKSARPAEAVVANIGTIFSQVLDVAPDSATALVRFNSSGTISKNDGLGALVTAAQSWYLPAVTGIGSSYWIRVDRVSGDAPSSGSLGVWQALNSARTWTLVSASGAGVKSCVLAFSIAADSGGDNVVSSGLINLFAESAA